MTTIIIMILQPQHKHQQTLPPPQIINPIPVDPPKQQSEESLQKPPAILTQLLSSSAQLLNEKSVNEIKTLLKYSEQKIHLSFANDANTYLSHLVTNSENNGTQDLLKEIIGLQNDIFTTKIELGSQKVYEKANIKALKSSISNKLTDMKKSIMSLSSIDRKASKQFENLMQFRKKSYWNAPSQRNQELKQFLTRMKRIYSEHKRNYKRSYMEMQKKTQKELEQEARMRQQQKKELYMKQLEKQTLWRKQRQKNIQQQRKKREDVQNMLKKYSTQQRIYQKKEEQFIKNFVQPMQEQRLKKLNQIKQSRQPIDRDQLQQHQQKYQEHKESMMQQINRKKEEEKQLDIKMQQQLKQLYHSKFHQEMEPRFYNSAKIQRESIRKKVREYGTQIKQRYKPHIDPLKRSQLKQSIRDLELAKDKKKRKTVLKDGTVVIEDKPQIDPRKLGVQYLQKLKEENQGKPRKKQERSASMMQLQAKSKIKRIDYLRQNKPNIKLKHTMGQWKKVIDDSSYSPRQKFVSIMQKVNVMQQKAKQKQSEMRSYKKGEKALQLKQQMDNFYMESVAAKMVILKDVILKQ